MIDNKESSNAEKETKARSSSRYEEVAKKLKPKFAEIARLRKTHSLSKVSFSTGSSKAIPTTEAIDFVIELLNHSAETCAELDKHKQNPHQELAR